MQTHYFNQCPDIVSSLLILEFFPFQEYIKFFKKEGIIRPGRISRKIILFQVCFMLLLIDAELEAFIWNYYVEQS